MTLLSLFMTSAGIFCFVPLSYRLVESGIIPASNGWLPLVPPPTFYYARRKKDAFPLLLVDDGDEAGSTWSQAPAHRHHLHQMRSPPHVPDYPVDANDTFRGDRGRPGLQPCADKWLWDTDIMTDVLLEQPAPLTPRHLSSRSPPLDPFHGHESTSFVSISASFSTKDGPLCDDCDTLLRREIPADHIPSVVRALALFESQGRLSASASISDVTVLLDDGEVVALTDAFSMLRL